MRRDLEGAEKDWRREGTGEVKCGGLERRKRILRRYEKNRRKGGIWKGRWKKKIKEGCMRKGETDRVRKRKWSENIE